MSKKYRWTNDKYRAIVAGKPSAGLEGLRNLVHGFESDDGYDLARVDEWTPQQKRRIRDYFHRVSQLQGQSKLVVRPRSKRQLRKLQDAFHGEVPSEKFKVAFLPYHHPRTTLPGAKRVKPKVTLLKDGVSIKTSVYDRQFIRFDPKRLVKNVEKEVRRVAAQMPKAAIFYAQVGANQTIPAEDLTGLIQQIKFFINRYDGKKPLPKDSGNYGDSPRAHHWRRWLEGMVGYKLPKGVSEDRAAELIAKGMEENRRNKMDRYNFMRRKGKQ